MVEGFYLNGKYDGERKVYFDKELNYIETFENGKLSGPAVYYTLGGKKEREGIYKNGYTNFSERISFSFEICKCD